ncbi:MAG: hypothetical protein BWZ10_00864 [candidate division BRC1 bacterium ADurb.BinA364]|nr:MAG: hypothetical protein BWZ10_00864 [candidate division BRC1 bacterium ADurb.BinA364]
MNKYAEMIKRNLAYAVLAVLGLLFGALFWLQSMEQSFYPPTPPPPAEKTPDPVFPNEAADMVLKSMSPMPPIEQSHLRRIVLFNPFDTRAYEGREQMQANADQRFRAAQAAYDSGDIDEAVKICTEIVDSIYPVHDASKKMLRKVEEDKKKAEEEAAAAAAAAYGTPAESPYAAYGAPAAPAEPPVEPAPPAAAAPALPSFE